MVNLAAPRPCADHQPRHADTVAVRVHHRRHHVIVKAAPIVPCQEDHAVLPARAGGDLSDGNKKFRAALATLVLDSPVGPIRLDANRQAIAPNFVTEVTKVADGTLVNKLVETIPEVPQTLGMDPAVFAKIGIPARENPPCKKTY